ncbi:MAG: NADH-ubiquinone oxidoreductase chain M, partial [uncultured Rubrobacteraceae bacterium]
DHDDHDLLPAARGDRHARRPAHDGDEHGPLHGPWACGGAVPADRLHLLRPPGRPRRSFAHAGRELDRGPGDRLPRRARRPRLRHVLPVCPADVDRGRRVLGRAREPEAILRDPVYRRGRDARGVRGAGPDPVLLLLRDHADPDVPARRRVGRPEPAPGGGEVLYLHLPREHGDARGLSGPRHPLGSELLHRRAQRRRPPARGPGRDSRPDTLRPPREDPGRPAAQLAPRRLRLQPDFDQRRALGHPAQARDLRALEGRPPAATAGGRALPAVYRGARGGQHNLRLVCRVHAAGPEGAGRLLFYWDPRVYLARGGLGERRRAERGGHAAGDPRALLGAAVYPGRGDRESRGHPQHPGARRDGRPDALGRGASGPRGARRDGHAGARRLRLGVYEHHGRVRRVPDSGGAGRPGHHPQRHVPLVHAPAYDLRPRPRGSRARRGEGCGAGGDGGRGAARFPSRPPGHLPGPAHKRTTAGRGDRPGRDRGFL